MGQAASQARQGTTTHTARHEYGRGGSLRSGLHSAIIAGLFASGIYLWLAPSSPIVLWTHVGLGLALVATLVPWLLRHVPTGLRMSSRTGFTVLSWALLADMVLVVLTGLTMSLPGLLWLAGKLWLPARELTETLSLLHFWGAWPILPVLILHLAMRHWGWVRP